VKEGLVKSETGKPGGIASPSEGGPVMTDNRNIDSKFQVLGQRRAAYSGIVQSTAMA